MPLFTNKNKPTFWRQIIMASLFVGGLFHFPLFGSSLDSQLDSELEANSLFVESLLQEPVSLTVWYMATSFAMMDLVLRGARREMGLFLVVDEALKQASLASYKDYPARGDITMGLVSGCFGLTLVRETRPDLLLDEELPDFESDLGAEDWRACRILVAVYASGVRLIKEDLQSVE